MDGQDLHSGFAVSQVCAPTQKLLTLCHCALVKAQAKGNEGQKPEQKVQRVRYTFPSQGFVLRSSGPQKQQVCTIKQTPMVLALNTLVKAWGEP